MITIGRIAITPNENERISHVYMERVLRVCVTNTVSMRPSVFGRFECVGCFGESECSNMAEWRKSTSGERESIREDRERERERESENERGGLRGKRQRE